jgi:Tol biopolymer transport system component
MAKIVGTGGNDTLTGAAANDSLIGDPHVVAATMIRVSTDASGAQADFGSFYTPVFSPDGSKVLFSSASTNLVTGDTNGLFDIFLKDLTTGIVTLVSTSATGVQANQFGSSNATPVFSPDGNSVVFSSLANNLVAGDTNGANDIYVKNLVTGAITRVNTDVSGAQTNLYGSFNAVFSPDGNSVMFESRAANLVSGDTNGISDIFVKNLVTGAITRVSTDSAGGQANFGAFTNSTGATFSADGTKIVFTSFASNLVTGDTNNDGDVFVKDLITGSVTLVSTDATGVQGNSSSYDGYGGTGAKFSPDGSKVIFSSSANNLVTGDTNFRQDLFVKDLATGAITRVSTDAGGAQGNSTSYAGVFSPDGTRVAFVSDSTNLVPGIIGFSNIYIKDLATGAITCVVTSAGFQADNSSFEFSFSPDGTKLVFTSFATNLVPGDTNNNSDIFVYTIPDGAGADVLDGGNGVDTVGYETALAGLTVDLRDNTGASNTGDAAGDTYISIENYRLTNFDDTFYGSDVLGAANWSSGLAGDDTFHSGGLGTTNTFHGREGVDTFYGSAANTLAFGGDGIDTYNGGTGVDRFWGAGDGDIFNGGGGADFARGGIGGDTLNGDADNDRLFGDAGADTLNGGNGIDFLYGGADDDTLNGDADNDRLFGNAGVDTLNGGSGIDVLHGGTEGDTLNGGGERDTLFGDAGDDTLNGDGGNDTLYGGDDADILHGGAGVDNLYGGAGADTFAFTVADSGNDIVYDYELGVDHVGLDAVWVNMFGSETSIVLELASGDQITFLGVDGVVDGAAFLADIIYI